MKILKQITIIAFLVLNVVTITYAQNSNTTKPFVIKGTLTEFSEQGKITLTYLTASGRKKETADLKDGNFEIKGTIEGPAQAFLRLSPLTKNGATVEDTYDDHNFRKLYLDPGQTTVTAKSNLSTADISGGSTQRDWLLLEKAQKSSKNREQMEDQFIPLHPASYVSFDIIKTRATINSNPEKLESLYLKLDPKIRNSVQGQEVGKNLSIAKIITIGKPALEFSLADTAGNQISLKSFRGKYVLIDFWASWCGPCRGENPNVLKAYQELKSKNFDVIAISLDSSRAPWMKAVHEDQMPWTQLSDLKGWKSKVALQYGITAIPQNFLVDPNGIIIGKDLRGENLTSKISKLIH